MIKAAIVTTTLPHFELPLFRLATTLPGIDVCVFHCDASANTRYDTEYQSVIDWGEDLRAGYPSSYHPTIAELKTAVWRMQPRVVLQYGYYWKGALSFLAQARLRGIAVVHRGLLSPHNDPRSMVISKAWRLLRPTMLRQFQAHHYGGSYSQRVLTDAGIKPERMFFVPFSVDTNFFSAASDKVCEQEEQRALRRSLGWSNDAPLLLYICQHNWFKGPDIMIEIAALAQDRIPELKLIMAGSGRMTEYLKAAAQSKLKDGSFHFPGFVSSKSTCPFYLASNLVAFPSRYDTWSRAVNEAMLCRRPCIVSDLVPAAGGLVEDGDNGYVVKGLDPGAHAERIVHYFTLPARVRTRMGEAARARALEFSYEAHIDEMRRSVTETSFS